MTLTLSEVVVASDALAVEAVDDAPLDAGGGGGGGGICSDAVPLVDPAVVDPADVVPEVPVNDEVPPFKVSA